MATVIACDPGSLPAALRRYPHWVLWKNEPDPTRTKPRKMPYGRDGRPARANDLASFLTFEEAAKRFAAGGYDGLGWYAWRSVPYVLIDLDHAVDASGAAVDWAQAILDRFPGAYVELSQSGTGLHLIVRARPNFGPDRDGGKKGNVEVYAGRHYLALTGSLYGDGALDDVSNVDRTAEVEALCAEAGIALAVDPVPAPLDIPRAPAQGVPDPAGGDAPAVPGAGGLTDEQVLAALGRGRQGPRLLALYYDGDERRALQSGRDSEDDYEIIAALCEITADDEQIIRLLGGSSLVRKKWSLHRPSRGTPHTWLRYSVENTRRSIAANRALTAATFRLLDATELEREPEPPWLLPGLVPAGAFAVLYGPSAAMKSFLALDWALTLAAAGRGVVYVAAEGWAGTKRRVRAWALDRAGGRVPPALTLMSGNVNLTSDRNVGDFLAAVRAKVGERPTALLVFDTLNQNMPGGNENAPEDMTAVIGSANYLRRETGATVLLLHHPRKADDVARGHSSLANAADTMLKLTVDGGSGARVLECTKQKDAAPFDARRYQFKQVVDPATGPVSLVLVPEGTPGTAPADGPGITAVLAALAELTGGRADRDAQFKDLQALATRKGAAETMVKRHLDDLVSAGRVLTAPATKKGRYRFPTPEETARAEELRVADTGPTAADTGF